MDPNLVQARDEPDEDRREELLQAAADRDPASVLDDVERLFASAEPADRALGADLAGTANLSGFSDEQRAVLVALVQGVLDGAEDPDLLSSCVALGGRLGRPELLPAVLRYVGHDDEAVRFGCAWALPNFDPDAPMAPDVVAALVALARDEDDDVRDWALFGLGRGAGAGGPVDRAETRALFRHNRTHPHEGVRFEATVALAQLGDLDALAAALADDEVAPETVEAAERTGAERLYPALLALKDRGWAAYAGEEASTHLETVLLAALWACRPPEAAG